VRGFSACVLAGWVLSGAAHAGPAAQDHPSTLQPEQPVISDIRIVGASIYTPEELQRRYGLIAGARLEEPVEEIEKSIKRRYKSDGYTYAVVDATLNEAGVLTIEIDEGQIDSIEFQGVEGEVEHRLRQEFAVRPGDVFNRPQASRALDEALEVGQGAIEPSDKKDAFTLVRDNGRRVLEVHLRTRTSRSNMFVGTHEREDWYSPVDAFNPALGFETTLFDAKKFNHTYLGGHVSYKFGPDRPGYSFGIERALFPDSVLQIGGSIHDMTASDDRWRISPLEQSLVAFGFRNTFRDYYRRKGYQLHGAVRPFANHEWLVAWREEEQLALVNETDYGLFRDDHDFRPNALAQNGDLRAVILGYTLDTRGLTRESPGERYLRHQVDSLFGSHAPRDDGARVEWTSEIAPAALDHDFDFTRHVLNARGWREISPGRMIGGRVIAGFSDGTLPPQRLFALGGIGSVHGYGFKEAVGEQMILLNGEFRQRFGRSSLGGIAFFDTGRVYRPVPDSTDDWLNGVGVGLELGSARIEFGWRLDDIPSSLQVLFRFGPTF
jgi:hypothetical protein